MGIGGSAAIGDCAIDLFYGSEFIARVYNTTTDNAVDDTDMLKIPGPLVCAPNEPIHLFVHDPSNTNPAVIQLAIEEIIPVRRNYRRF